MTCADRCVVYWVHTREQTDVFTEGYVGITTQQPTQRFEQHKRIAARQPSLPIHHAIRKHGASLQFEILVIGSLTYCLYIEQTLRPIPNIGYNVGVGGVSPRLHTKATAATIAKLKLRPKVAHTRAFREKLAERNRSRCWTDAQREKISVAQKAILPWEKVGANLTTWQDARRIYDFMREFPSAGTKSAAKTLGYTYSQLRAIFQRIRAGWNPHTCTQWLLFLERTK